MKNTIVRSRIVNAAQAVSIISALIFAQFALVAAPVTVQAAGSGYVTLNSFSGTPGSTITVSGGGFTANDTVSISVGSGSTTTTTSGNDGSFSSSVTIPVNAVQGPLSITATDTHGNSSSNSYYVVPLSPSISTSATTNSPFGVVSITGTGFAPNEIVTIALAGSTTSAQATAAGTVSSSIVIPFVPAGLYNLTVTGNSSKAFAIDYFYINAFYPSTGPSTYYLVAGQTLTFTGTGFAPNEKVNVTEGNSSTILSSFTVGTDGTFTNAGGFKIPTSFKSSSRTFTLTGTQSGASASTGVTIGDFYASVTPSAYWLLPGTSLSFNGSGFAAGETITVYQNNSSTPFATIKADEFGGFAALASTLAPYEFANGTVGYTFIGSDSGASAKTSVTVGSFYPSITPSEYYVQPNATITLSGSGFAAGESVTIAVSNASTTTTTADSFGGISAKIKIPYNSLGSATLTAAGSNSKTPVSVGVTLASFYPSITPSTWYAFPGDKVSFTATGFAPNETVSISGVATSSVTTDEFGTFTTGTFTIPVTAQNSVSAGFSGSISNKTVVSTIALGTLSPYLSSDSYSATPGQVVHITGSGFSSAETVHVTAGDYSTDVPVNTDRSTGAVAITIPFNATSPFAITFTGNSTGATASLPLYVTGFYGSLTSDNYYVQPGATVHLTATGFAPNETINVTSGTASSTVVGTGTTDTFGSATMAVQIPFGSTGSVNLVATGSKSNASASLAITLAPFSSSVAPSTYYTTPGSTVTFTGTGFVPNETVNVSGTVSGSVNADSTGAFTYSAKIPTNAKAAHFSFAGSQSGQSTVIDITLANFYSSISLSTYYAQGGSALTVTGNGFGSNETVTITSGDQNLGTVTTDENGAFKKDTTVPFKPAGDATITATGSDTGAVATSPITIAPVYTSFELGSYAAKGGESVTLMGSGYLANETINITTDRTNSDVVATFTTGSDGKFNGSYTLPSSFVEGNLTLTATSAHSFDSKSITMYVVGQ